MILFPQLISLLSDILAWWRNSSTSMSVTIAIIFLSFWYGWIFTKKSNKKNPPLPPGPRGLSLVGNLLSLDPEFHTYFTSLGKRYGPIFSLRLGSKFCVVVNSPELAYEVLRKHDTTFANRDPPAVTAEIFGAKDIVWTPYGPEWRMLRKVCMQEMLNTSSLDAFYSLRRREVRKTIANLYNKSKTGSPVNVAEQIFLATLNVLTSMMWGGASLPSTKMAAMGAEFRQVVADITDFLGAPNVSDFFPILAPFDLQGNSKKMRKEIEKLDRIYDVLIDERNEIGGEGKDILQVLLRWLKNGVVEKTPFTMNHIKAILVDLLVGGTDSTSSTIEFTMSEVMNHPQLMATAQKELDMVVGRNKIVEESHIKALPYLNAIIKEALRLHPVVPNLVPHCPSKTCTIGGYTVPKGACVFINVYGIHNDPKYWSDPEKFAPERFLNVEMDLNGRDFRYLPFGSGRRSCIGMVLAHRMLLLLLASLLHSFDWKSPKQEKLDITEKFGIVLKKKTPLIAVPTPRLSEARLYE